MSERRGRTVAIATLAVSGGLFATAVTGIASIDTGDRRAVPAVPDGRQTAPPGRTVSLDDREGGRDCPRRGRESSAY